MRDVSKLAAVFKNASDSRCTDKRRAYSLEYPWLEYGPE